MTRIFFLLIVLFTVSTIQAQSGKGDYDKGLELAQQNKPDEAIKYFDQSIALDASEYVAWYNRGIAKTMLHRYEDALPDFDQTITLAPGYKKAYLNRATTKKHLTDYDGAMADYNQVLKLDSTYSEAYYDRGLLYNLLGKRIPACLDFEHALRLGYKAAQSDMNGCIRRPTADTSIHSILRLTRTSTDAQYAFTPEHPVKVGIGPESGPNNARTYLDLLRDAKGKPLKFTLAGTCCPYPSTHALFGKEAVLDKYQITYTAADGAEKKTFIYISFYDYDEPQVPVGLKTVAAR